MPGDFIGPVFAAAVMKIFVAAKVSHIYLAVSIVALTTTPNVN